MAYGLLREFNKCHNPPGPGGGRFCSSSTGAFSPQFTHWFRGSKVVDAKGNPLKVYHGTARAFDQFSLDHPANGGMLDDGIGHFFTDSPGEAEYFARNQLGRMAGRNPDPERMAQIHTLIKNTVADIENTYEDPDLRDRTLAQFKQSYGIETDPIYQSNAKIVPAYVAIKRPKVFATQTEYFDAIEESGRRLENAYNEYDEYGDPAFRQTETRPVGKEFRQALLRQGYDGIIIRNSVMYTDEDTGEKTGGQWFIAFNPKQVKSAIGNKGTFRKGGKKFTESFGLLREFNDCHNPPGPGGGQFCGDGGDTFKAWFSGSKIVDDSGKPLRVYHGTTTDFDEFSLDAYEDVVNTDVDAGAGYFFAERPNEAAYFTQEPTDLMGSRSDTYQAGANLRAAYLAIKKPMVYETQRAFRAALNDVPYNREGDGFALRKALRAKGYDGIVIEDSQLEGVNGDSGRWVIAFDASQIRPALSRVKESYGLLREFNGR